MSSSNTNPTDAGEGDIFPSHDGAEQPGIRSLHACSGEVELSAASAAAVDAGGAARVKDVNMLLFGAGGARAMRESLPPHIPGGLTPASTFLPASSMTRDPSATYAGLPLARYPAAPPPGDGGGIGFLGPSEGPRDNSVIRELQKFHRLLRGRYVWALVLGLSLGATGAIVGYRSGVRTYRSTGSIRVMPIVPKVMYAVDEASVPMYETFVDAQISLLKSQRVIEQALDEADWRKVHPVADKSDSAVAEFGSGLEISRQGELIWVRAANPSPNVAVAAVNSTIAAYLKVYAQLEGQSGDKRRELREELQTKLRADWNGLRDEIQELAKAYGTDDLKTQFENKQEARNTLEKRIREVQMSLATLSEIQSEPTSRPAISRPEDVAFIYQDPVMKALLERKGRYEEQLEAVRLTSGTSNTAYKDAETRLNGVRREITLYTAQYAHYLEAFPTNAVSESSDPRRLEAQQKALQVLYAKENDEMLALGKRQLKIAELRERAAEVKQRLDETTRAIEQLEVEKQVMGRIVVMGQGDRPLGAFRDTRLAMASAGGFGGMGVGIGAMLVLGLLKRKIERLDDADAELSGLALLGMVPALPEDLSDAVHAALAAHCVHEIRTRLQILGQGIQRPTFAITSATAGAGKTSLTLALGLSFAAGNQRTLLIDCDIVGGGLTRRVDAIARRRIGTILLRHGCISQKQLDEALWYSSQSGRPVGQVLVDLGYVTAEVIDQCVARQADEAMGLLDALEGEDLQSCVVETGIDGLSVLPLGKATAQDAASLSPASFRRLLDRASRCFDVVIIDTGPVLGSLEASVVASQSDAVVLAVAKGESKMVVERSASQLCSLGTRIAGIVFNRARDEDVVAYSSHASSSYGVRSMSGSGPIEHKEVPEAQRLGSVARAVASWSPALGVGSRRGRVREAKRTLAELEPY